MRRDTRYTASMDRKLRIAASTFFALLTIAICVLWARSYWQFNIVLWRLQDGAPYQVTSAAGQLIIFRFQPSPSIFWPTFHVISTTESMHGPKCRYGATNFGSIVSINFPYVVPTSLLLLTAVATSMRLRLRFSLRTLLIATTLVALMLGLGVWAAA